MNDFYKRFCIEKLDENGILSEWTPIYKENFNFAYDVIDEIASAEPDKTALVWCNVQGEEAVFTFGQIQKLTNQAANLLRSKGVKKGDKVMLILKRHHQYWPAILALHKLGAVAVPATNLLRKKDIVYRFEAAGIKHIICTAEGEVAEYVEQACKEYPHIRNRFIVRGTRPGWQDYDALLREQPDTFNRTNTLATDMMLLYFTSGTTGYPKMVYHDFTYPLGHIITAKYWHNVTEDGLHLTVSETGWAKSVWGKIYGQWIMRTAIFVYDFDKFVPSGLLSVIEKYKITTFCAAPTIYRYFIKDGLKNYDLSSIRHATTAGEALNPEVFRKFYEFTGLKLMEGFGQTETTLLTYTPAGTEPHPGSMGRPSPLYKLDVLDENGMPAGPNEVGELVVQANPQDLITGLFRGYYMDQPLTDEVWHDGYYHTLDTVYRDSEGFFYYVGRTDDMIKSSGYRIGPFEIESVLMEHPAVLECAVTGEKDDMRGVVIKATVVLVRGYEPTEELKSELQSHVKEQTAPYKYPRIVEFVEELPKTISGKIKRAQIRGDIKE